MIHFNGPNTHLQAAMPLFQLLPEVEIDWLWKKKAAQQELNRAFSGWRAAGHGFLSLQTAPLLPLGQSSRNRGVGWCLRCSVRLPREKHALFYLKSTQAHRKAVDGNFPFPPHTAVETSFH